MQLGINDGVAVHVNDEIDIIIALTLNDYQMKAESTAIYPNKGNNIVYPTLGLSGEAGECSEKVKKLIRDFDGILTDEYKEKIAKELGDVLWYVAMLAHEIKYDLQTIAEMNLEKLSSRKTRNQLQGNGDDR